jgi:hypothetical protein
MFDLMAAWFVVGMFVAGCWIVVGAFLPLTPKAQASGRKRVGDPE